MSRHLAEKAKPDPVQVIEQLQINSCPFMLQILADNKENAIESQRRCVSDP